MVWWGKRGRGGGRGVGRGGGGWGWYGGGGGGRGVGMVGEERGRRGERIRVSVGISGGGREIEGTAVLFETKLFTSCSQFICLAEAIEN